MKHLLALILSLAPAFASANCGLNFCPLEGHRPGETAGPRWLLSTELQQTGFDFGGVSGSYQSFLPRVEFHGVPGWTFGGALPAARVTIKGETHAGLGNPLAFAETKLPDMGRWKPAAGLQVELPYGDEEDGIASDHLMFVPYASVTKDIGGGDFLVARAGFRYAAGEEEAVTVPAPTPLVVNPHEDQEVLFRVAAGTHWDHNDLMTQFFLDGAQVVSGGADHRTFLSAGLLGAWRLDRDWDLTGLLELPVTSPARFDYRLGLGLTFRR